MKKETVNQMKKIIHDATLADSWEEAVDQELEENDKEIPTLLSAFYTIAETMHDFETETTPPTIQELLKERTITDAVDDYLADRLDIDAIPLQEIKATKKKKKINWEEINEQNQNTDTPLEQFFEFDSYDWTIPMISLFTHIGIRVTGGEGADKEKGAKFCLWPACQPNVNNRTIPMDWIYDKTNKSESALVNGILKRGDLAWTGQKVFFLPYTVGYPNEEKKDKEARLVSVISDTTSGGGNDEEGDSVVTEGPKFDGDPHATLASSAVAAKAFLALSVSPFIPTPIFKAAVCLNVKLPSSPKVKHLKCHTTSTMI